LREHVNALPERQQVALRTAAGAADGAPPDLFLVELDVLGLFAGRPGTPRSSVRSTTRTGWIPTRSMCSRSLPPGWITATPCRHGPPPGRPIAGAVIGFAPEWEGQRWLEPGVATSVAS
jgi:hypothetical protein